MKKSFFWLKISKKISKKKFKHGNKITEIDGKKFRSKFEAKRHKELKILEERKEINNLLTQVPFIIFDSFTDKNGIKHSGIKYIADFTYYKNGYFIIEETKGYETAYYKMKRKLIIKMIDKMENTIFFENRLKK